MSLCPFWSLQEIGRLAFAHRLDPDPLAAALGLDAVAMAKLIATGEVPDALPCPAAAWVLNILVRLEVRCGGDSSAIAAAMHRPSEMLAGASIAEALGGAPDLLRLRKIRIAAGAVPVPRVRMWRAADRYS